MRKLFPRICGSLLIAGVVLSVAAPAPKPPPNPALAPISDVPGLPRILLIGDSISIGYTLPVRTALQGRANVHRVPQNASSTGFGLNQLDAWLGRGRWDVIHFNFGLHDAKLPPEGTRHAPPEVYEENLRKIVRRLKTTGATLIWATTTPVPMGGELSPTRRFGSVDAYNRIAAKVMRENGVRVNDLNAVIAPQMAQVGRPNDVHFSDAGYALLGQAVAAAIASALPPERRDRYDVVVYGGTASGVVAAVQAARMGRRVVLVEPGRHLGGMTSGGLGATDIGNKDTIGGLAREFYARVKRHYDRPEAWLRERPSEYTKPARHDPAGDGVMWYFEPSVAERIFNDLAREAGVLVVYGERLELKTGVRKLGPRIAEITMESGRSFAGRVFIDATYEGDLLAKAGVAYHVGREANSVYGETLNGVQARRLPYHLGNFFRPTDPYRIAGDRASGLLDGIDPGQPEPDGTGDRRVQAYCYRLCLTDVPENRVPFTAPEGYNSAQYELVLRWLATEPQGKLFPDHPKPPRAIENPALGRNPFAVIMPNRKTDSNTKGPVSFDFVGQNYEYPDGDYATRERIIAAHIRWQQGLLYFMANDPRVPEQFRRETQRWGYAKDEFADTDHWPHQLYVREARRMIGDYVMTELDATGKRTPPDPVGLGSYAMDSHGVRRFVTADGWTRNEGTMGGGVKPYPISGRSLVPRANECDNLVVPVCVSASHVAYGSIRMEPVYMILGQSAGTTAALAAAENVAVQALAYERLRARLVQDGQRLQWPVK